MLFMVFMVLVAVDCVIFSLNHSDTYAFFILSMIRAKFDQVIDIAKIVTFDHLDHFRVHLNPSWKGWIGTKLDDEIFVSINMA